MKAMNQLTKKQSISLLLLLNALGLLALFSGINRQQTIEEHVEIPPDTPTSGVITVYSAFDEEDSTQYLADFRASYPDIEVNVVNGFPFQLNAMLMSEGNNPTADVIWGTTAGPILYLEWNGFLKGYAPRKLDHIKEHFRDSRNNPHWVGLGGRVLSFCVNPQKLSEADTVAPTSWQDLTKPEYKGLIVLPDPQVTESGYFIMAAFIRLNGEVLGWKYLDELHANVGKITTQDPETCQLVSQGDYAIGLSFTDYKKSQFDNLKIIFPSEGAIWDIETVALINKNKVKLSAQTFIDWATKPSTIELYAQNTPLRPMQTNVPLPPNYTPEAVENLLDQDFPWMAANYGRLVAQWSKSYSSEPAQ